VDILFFCRDALYDSLINNLTLAMSLQKGGKTTGIVFTGDALHCLCNGMIKWPNSLVDVDARKTILSGAKSLGLSLQNSRDPKSIDIKPLFLQARESGVLLYACPVWTNLLQVAGKLPEGLSEIGMEKLLGEINSTSKVMGAL